MSDFFVAATGSHYLKGWKGEVSNELAHRHGEDGTGFLKIVPDGEAVGNAPDTGSPPKPRSAAKKK